MVSVTTYRSDRNDDVAVRVRLFDRHRTDIQCRRAAFEHWHPQLLPN